MQTSQVVDRWHEKGRAEGQLEARRDDLVALLEKRFGPLPQDLLERIQASTDETRLKSALPTGSGYPRHNRTTGEQTVSLTRRLAKVVVYSSVVT